MTQASFLFLGVTAAALVGACTSGNPSGGDARFDAAPSTPPGGTLLCHPAARALGTGHTWAELYADYFGPSSGGDCGKNPGNCHGEPTSKGSAGSNFTCPPTRDGCYIGMTKGIKTTAPSNVPAGRAPGDTILIQILRNADGSGGSMPQSPVCSFDKNDYQRLSDWIAAGAPNDGVDDAGADAAPDAPGDAADAGPG